MTEPSKRPAGWVPIAELRRRRDEGRRAIGRFLRTAPPPPFVRHPDDERRDREIAVLAEASEPLQAELPLAEEDAKTRASEGDR